MSKATPAETAASKSETAEFRSKATPMQVAKLTTPVQVAKLTTPVRATPAAVKPRFSDTRTASLGTTAFAPAVTAIPPAKTTTIAPTLPPPVIPAPRGSGRRYPWKTSIVTTVFWVGEPPSGNNPTPNHSSSWDAKWAQSFGGFDNPNPEARRNYLPVRFTPRLNPFYVALPYNDVTRGTTKPEARRVIPWFREAYQREGLSVCRDRWVAIRNSAGKVAYAQWSDCGPFRTDHWQYVFGNERPKPNLNKGAGLDVSPAVRDYLGLDGTDLTDWRFVEVEDVPHGPWATHGQNNTVAHRAARSPKRAEAGDANGRLRVRKL